MWLGSQAEPAAALGDMLASLWSGKWCSACQRVAAGRKRSWSPVTF